MWSRLERSKALPAAGVAAAILVLSAVTFATTGGTPAKRAVTGTGASLADPSAMPSEAGATAAPGVTRRGGRAGATPRPGSRSAAGAQDACAAGRNDGATDTGVTAHEIRFAATIVKTGVAKDFLSDAQFGMEAVRQKVNRAGGICGRIVQIEYNDDGWDPQRGRDIIKKDILEDRYFGLAVNPSSEGVRGVIDAGDLTQARFPLIGSDGQLIDQYVTGDSPPRAQPWVWPVATSTASVMHIMAHDAYARGARTFGIVWDVNYRFGVEGHAAFVGAVKRAGGTVSSDTGVQGGQQSYANEVNTFVSGCGGAGSLSRCDFIAVLLEPATASRWIGDGGLGNGSVRPRTGIGAPQPLFVDSFARDCAKYCANMWVWTSFNPPIPPFDADAAVAAYRADLAAVSSTADPNNPHVEGAYIGMQLLVEALRRLGPAPTRAGLRQVLDTMTLETRLSEPITFTAASHFANTGAQAFEAIVNNGSFASWRYTNSGYITDPDVGKDVAG